MLRTRPTYATNDAKTWCIDLLGAVRCPIDCLRVAQTSQRESIYSVTVFDSSVFGWSLFSSSKAPSTFAVSCFFCSSSRVRSAFVRPCKRRFFSACFSLAAFALCLRNLLRLRTLAIEDLR